MRRSCGHRSTPTTSAQRRAADRVDLHRHDSFGDQYARVIDSIATTWLSLAHDDPRLVIDEQIGQWYIDHRTAGSTLYAMCASAGVYAAADAIPPYPYLWLDGVQNGKGAQEKLVELFSGDDAPTFVAVYQDASQCNPSGRGSEAAAAAIHHHHGR